MIDFNLFFNCRRIIPLKVPYALPIENTREDSAFGVIRGVTVKPFCCSKLFLFLSRLKINTFLCSKCYCIVNVKGDGRRNEMISSAKSSSEINHLGNVNGSFTEAQEFSFSKSAKNVEVLCEKGKVYLTSDKSQKWKEKFSRCHLPKFPIFIFFISALEVLIFYGAEEKLKRILIYDIEKKNQIWRFLTYMLLHTDSIHLGLNVLIQGLLGTPLELEQGQLRCAAVYFGGGLAGSLGTSVLGAFTLMVGASGGVYSLLMSQIPNVVLSFRTIKYAGFRIAAVAVLTASDVLYIFFHVHFYNNERPRIGWVAHVSGAVAGLLLGFLLFNGTSESKRTFQVTSCLIFFLSFLLVVIFCFGFGYKLSF